MKVHDADAKFRFAFLHRELCWNVERRVGVKPVRHAPDDGTIRQPVNANAARLRLCDKDEPARDSHRAKARRRDARDRIG